MARNIVILLDGTSNEIETDRSNILRLYGTLNKTARQIVYYDPGVGTFGADNAWSRTIRKAYELWGLVSGWGLDNNVLEAYRFLVKTYRSDGIGGADRIHIFGFSRGAYSARVLAGFLHGFGLIERRNLNLAGYAYRAYKRVGETEDKKGLAELRLHQRVLQPSRPAIKLLGLFDTVGSVIESGRFGPRFKKHAFTSCNPSVETVRHAVALNERRRMFRPELWPKGQMVVAAGPDAEKPVEQDVKEVWFSGVHSDVGGGYPESQSHLAKIPLDWMITESAPFGLDYNEDLVKSLVRGEGAATTYVAPDPTQPPNESMSIAWRLLEYLPRKSSGTTAKGSLLGYMISPCEWRSVPEEACIHDSVFEQESLPPNLPRQRRFRPG